MKPWNLTLDSHSKPNGEKTFSLKASTVTVDSTIINVSMEMTREKAQEIYDTLGTLLREP